MEINYAPRDTLRYSNYYSFKSVGTYLVFQAIFCVIHNNIPSDQI